MYVVYIYSEFMYTVLIFIDEYKLDKWQFINYTNNKETKYRFILS